MIHLSDLINFRVHNRELSAHIQIRNVLKMTKTSCKISLSRVLMFVCGSLLSDVQGPW